MGIFNSILELGSSFWAEPGSMQANLHTYAPIKDVLYHLGLGALIPLPGLHFTQKSGTIMSLSIGAALHWSTLS